MTDERLLLRHAQDLDEQALATIFDTYYRALYRYIYLQVRHGETAEDLTAEVFSRFLNALQRRRGPRHYLKAWLFRVAHNLVIDEMRKRGRVEEITLSEELQTRDEAVEDQVHEALLAGEMRRALNILTSKQRAVITLKYLAGMDNVEVSRVLALPVTAVKSLQHRGLAALRRQLQVCKVEEETT